jgi:hypothetical protein
VRDLIQRAARDSKIPLCSRATPEVMQTSPVQGESLEPEGSPNRAARFARRAPIWDSSAKEEPVLKEAMATKSIPLNDATKISVDLLSFDTTNPRYSGEHLKTDNDIIAHLNETADLQELLQSIAANGYIDIEPLVVMQAG